MKGKLKKGSNVEHQSLGKIKTTMRFYYIPSRMSNIFKKGHAEQQLRDASPVADHSEEDLEKWRSTRWKKALVS